MKIGKQLIKSVIGTMLIRTIGTGLAFLLSVVLARTLGSEGFGLYSYVLSIIIFLSIPIQAGFPNLIVRETAKAHLNGNWPTIKGLWLWVLKLIFIYFFILIIVLLLISLFNLHLLSKDRSEVFLIGFWIIPFIAIILSQGSILRGIGNVVIGIVPDSIIRPGLTLLLITIIMFTFSKESITPYNSMLIYLISIIFTFCVSLFLMWKITPKENRDISVFDMEIKQWKIAAYPLTVVGGLQLMYSYTDIIILGVYSSNEDVGIYRAVGQLGTLVVFGLSAINQMLHSHFAKLYISKEMEQLQKLVTQSSLTIFFFAAIPAMIFFFFGEFILRFIFGEEYVLGFMPLVVLTIGQLANAAFGSVGALLNMTGHEKDAMKGMGYSLVINILLAFILIPQFGMLGAALSTAISLVVWNIILRHYVKKRLDIESIGFIQILKQRNSE